MNKIYYHLPGLFEFYELYKMFLRVYKDHNEYFYNWCEIGSIYGSPADCLWGGGRVGFGDNNVDDVISLMKEYNISPRLTFSNSLLNREHLNDYNCNKLCNSFFNSNLKTGIIIYSDILLDYLKVKYPNFYFVSSTTKVITDFKVFIEEVNRKEFTNVVPDFRLNKCFEKLKDLTEVQKNKIEFLCNECCDIRCIERKQCYETVSKKNLSLDIKEFSCKYTDTNGYRISRAMKNPSFISINDILNTYEPMGFTNFKIEGRSLGSATVLELLLYYMVKPEYQINVREEIYLDSELDLF